MKIIVTFIAVLCGLTAAAQTQIVSAEYFINNDPGIGNATTITIAPGQSIQESFDVSVASLGNGIHYLHVRVLNEEGKWSLYSRKPFFVTEFGETNNTIVAAEYFIGNDPGTGNAESLTITPGNTITENFEIPFGNLDPGYHMLHIRVKNTVGKWSHYARKPFYLFSYTPELNITDAEYFIDVDPGIGNGTALEISPAHQISENFSIVLPDTISEGDHLLYIRVRNEAHNWSFYATELFTVEVGVGVDKNQLNFSVYPNPSNGIIFLETGDVQPEFVRIIDMTGKIVMTPNPQDRQIDIHQLVPGTYLLQMAAKGNLYSKKLIRQ
ncbi:MAG: T9SS C-terminal target domain-containing protein [Cryomorphaceae bacterium]|nr:MAG: T9SS C-terminal target domain-containing protein [Cryomorphaceae bacterium]